MRKTSSRTSNRAHRRGGVLRMLGDGQTGFTIIEVVVASLMVAMMAGAVATALLSTAAVSGDQRRRSQADELAQQDQERMKGMSIKQLQGYDATQTLGPYDGTSYVVHSTGQFLSAAGNPSCTSSDTAAAAYVRITSTVNWADNMKGSADVNNVSGWSANSVRPPIKQESLITPRTGGTLLVNVNDQNNVPVPGAQVDIFGPKESETSLTSAEGCAVFGGIKQTGYYVGAKKSGYVDKDGNDYPFTGATAGSGTTVATPFKMGPAGSVTANFKTTINGSTIGGQKAPSISWHNPGMTASRNAAPATVPNTTVSTPSPADLFPFNNGTSGVYTNNYVVWAGSCDETRPLAANSSYATVSPSTTALLNGTSQPQVQMPALNLQVQWRPNSTTAYATVVPAHIELTDACAETWFADVRSTTSSTLGSLNFPGQPYAPTTPTSSLLTVCADYRVNSTSPYYKATSTTANNNFTAATSKTVQIDGSVSTNQGTC